MQGEKGILAFFQTSKCFHLFSIPARRPKAGRQCYRKWTQSFYEPSVSGGGMIIKIILKWSYECGKYCIKCKRQHNESELTWMNSEFYKRELR